MVQKIQSENFFDYDVVVATPDMMSVVGRSAAFWARRASSYPKAGTVTNDIARQLPKSRPVKSSTAGQNEYYPLPDREGILWR